MTETHTLGGSAVERLQALGLHLPAVGDSSMYVNHRSAGTPAPAIGFARLLRKSPVEIRMICTMT